MTQDLKVHSSNVRCKETVRREVVKPKVQKGSKAKNEDNAKTAKKQIVVTFFDFLVLSGSTVA